MRLAVLLITALAITGCASSGSKPGSSSRLAFVNLMDQQAQLYSFSDYSQQNDAMTVDWDIPGLIQQHITDALENEVVPYAPDNAVAVNDIMVVRKAVVSSQPSKLKTMLGNACYVTGAEAVIVLSSDKLNVQRNNTQALSGYGVFTLNAAKTREEALRSGSLSLGSEPADTEYYSFAIPAVSLISCSPVTFLTMSTGYRSPVLLEGFRPANGIGNLSATELEQLHQGVLRALDTSLDAELPNVLDQVSGAVAEFFGQ